MAVSLGLDMAAVAAAAAAVAAVPAAAAAPAAGEGVVAVALTCETGTVYKPRPNDYSRNDRFIEGPSMSLTKVCI